MMKLRISMGRETTSFVPVTIHNLATVRNVNHRCAEPLFIGAPTENPGMRIKTMKIKKLTLAASLTALLSINSFAFQPPGTGTTYQGRLMDGGVPANGTYDFGFVLHDDPTNLTYLGNSIMITAVPVSNGLFTVQLNTAGEFGPNAFNGQARWLEVDVRTNNNILLNNFTVLSPRVPLTVAPHAAFALNSSNALNAAYAATVADGSVTSSKLAPGAVAWSSITGIPAGFADGVDNDTTYSAGAGLTLGGPSNQFSVNFAGSGGENTAARSDHDHFGANWSGNSSGYGLVVVNSSTTGTGIYGQQGTGSGVAAPLGFRAAVWGESSQGDAVYGATGASSGAALSGHASSTNGFNYGVYGQTDSPNGAGVLARGSGNGGTALRISNGGIRVSGAGVNSGTPAFVHVISASNTDTNGWISTINNPYCNNDPNALLYVMPVGGISTNLVFSESVNLYYDDGALGFANNRWILEAAGASGGFYAGQRYNILVVKP
jgi:hypothetical protein